MSDKRPKTIVILPDIRSAHNVGSIFRTGDGAGVDGIYLVGYTPSPIDRFGRPQKEIAKVALGAEQTIPWEYFETFQEAAEAARDGGYEIVAVEQTDDAKDYKKFEISKNTAFVFGNEVEGLSGEILEQCDQCIEITMHGEKNSLNVSVTAGVILFNYSK